MREGVTQGDRVSELQEELVEGEKIVWQANPPDVSKP
jgi:hypothetical protein